MKLKIVAAFVIALAVGSAVGCQTYEFQPVDPLAIAQTTQARNVVAKQQKPNMMILLDKSGSMSFPISMTDPACQSPATCPTNGIGCPASCKTRITELRAAMNTFLSGNGSVARLGLAIYPADNVCTPTGSQQVLEQLSNSNDVATELQAAANAINQRIQTLPTGGGTPTAKSLDFLNTYAPLKDSQRTNIALLLTDGLPNCNPRHDPVIASCKCTAAKAMPTSNCGQPITANQCLDRDGSVEAVQSLLNSGIKTIVVGFGADLVSGDGPDTLNAMATAGGLPRRCPNGMNSECGTNDTCDAVSKLCGRRFYQASNSADLAAALLEISKIVGIDPCDYTLSANPSDEKFLSVLIDGQNVPPDPTDSWVYDAAKSKVTFKGALCTKVSSATPNAPVKVEIRVIESL